MAQFNVYRVMDGLILDCQADLLADLPTRLTVPLEPIGTAPRGAARLNPVLTIGSEQFMMLTEFAGAVPRRALSDAIGSLRGSEYDIKRALDMLVSGV